VPSSVQGKRRTGGKIKALTVGENKGWKRRGGEKGTYAQHFLKKGGGKKGAKKGLTTE